MNLLDPLTGLEALTRNGVPEQPAFVRDFWRWGFSALHNTFLRGYFAEYLIYRQLLQAQDGTFLVPESHFSTKMEGDMHDLVFFLNDEKFTIQVKSKDSLTASEIYKTSLTQGYDTAANRIIREVDHWSDFYVFAYLTLDKAHGDLLDKLHKQWNPAPHLATEADKQRYKAAQDAVVRSVLEIGNWTFFVLKRADLRGREEVTLSELQEMVRNDEAMQTSLDNLPFILRMLAAGMIAERELAAR